MPNRARPDNNLSPIFPLRGPHWRDWCGVFCACDLFRMNAGVMWLNYCVFFGRLVQCCLFLQENLNEETQQQQQQQQHGAVCFWVSLFSTKSSLLHNCHHRPVTHTVQLWMKEIKIGECHSHTKEVIKCEYKGVGGSKHFLNSYLLIAVSYGSHKHIFCFNFYANISYIFTPKKIP